MGQSVLFLIQIVPELFETEKLPAFNGNVFRILDKTRWI